MGADISFSDPHIPILPKMRHFDVPKMESQDLNEQYLSGLDCTLIATDHTAFDWSSIVRHSQLVIDTRNATVEVTEDREKIWKA